MALTVTNLDRIFIYKDKNNEIKLNDIAGLTPEDVMKVYAGSYPELTNGEVHYKGIEDNNEVYEFRTVIGVKG